MDLDAFVTEHGGEWHRLRILLGRSRRKLTAAEVDEMVTLYRRTATHLSVVQSRSPDPNLVSVLTQLVLRARARLNPAPGFSAASMVRFLTVVFPLAAYRARWWCLGVAVGFVTVSTILIRLVATDQRVALEFMPENAVDDLVNHGFEAYYSEHPPQNFTFAVWTNNAWVSAVCLAGGVLVLPVLYLLWENALNLGIVGGLMVGHHRTDTFLGLLLVHGMLELTCIFVAAGVGLRIGWAWIAPGPLRTRGQSVAAAGRSGVAVAIGLVPVLLVSGFVEGFVTPAPLPPPVKLAFGAFVWLAFLAYMIGFGARAVRNGETADVDELDREAFAPTV
ncbi:stage II sporulation protein M [Micromonospora zhanjiangensis]|uniref:Stage II sporulation protein M n=1 Tax=Micromonospora zhanjiangensis TaxID=1522057 RepID=A0ABV8KS13_9ACTN